MPENLPRFLTAENAENPISRSPFQRFRFKNYPRNRPMSHFIELDGDVHVPMYEKFEAELAELKTTADAKARASERLAAYRRSGERNAIVVRNFDFNSRGGAAPNLGSSS